MEISFLLMRQIAELFLMIFMGFLLVKMKMLKSEDSKILSTVVLYIIIPCVIVDAFQVEYTQEKMQGLLLAFLGAIVTHILWFIMMPFFKRYFHLDEVEMASVLYSNAGNLIIPIVSSVLGKEWILYTSAFMSVQLVLIWSHGKRMLCREKGFDFKKIFCNINMMSVAVGAVLFFTRIQLPDMIGETIGAVGSMIGPLSMIVTGMLMAGVSFKKVFSQKRIYLVTALRLVIFPLVVLFVLKYSGMIGLAADGQTILLVTLLATMTPSASSVTQMAQIYGNDASYCSAINVMSTLLCIITMPLLVTLYMC